MSGPYSPVLIIALRLAPLRCAPRGCVAASRSRHTRGVDARGCHGGAQIAAAQRDAPRCSFASHRRRARCSGRSRRCERTSVTRQAAPWCSLSSRRSTPPGCAGRRRSGVRRSQSRAERRFHARPGARARAQVLITLLVLTVALPLCIWDLSRHHHERAYIGARPARRCTRLSALFRAEGADAGGGRATRSVVRRWPVRAAGGAHLGVRRAGAHGALRHAQAAEARGAHPLDAVRLRPRLLAGAALQGAARGAAAARCVLCI